MTGDSDMTRRLLHRIGRGEEQFDALFQRHREALKKLVDMRLDAALRARLDASDVVQEAHAEAYRRLDDYLARKPMPFYLWLRKTAQERLIMLRRHHVGAGRRSTNREISLPNQSTITFGKQLCDSIQTPSQIVGQQELCCRVNSAINQLSELDREVVIMRIYEGLSYEEIASVLNIEAATARKRQGRALIKLHRFLVANEN